jgi:ubiquinone/menaquinone biosynthesis C-methylase UbiE
LLIGVDALSLKQWETYYRGGMLATGPAGADGLYDLEVRAAWEAFFGTLPQQARLLDIGTGNGVLPLIALEVAARREADWQIDATDLAQIDPLRFVVDGERRFAGVRFHRGVASEKLPFQDCSFDAVSGHYALEYSDTALSLPQLHRVLKAGGEAQFVLHHTDSRLLQSARRSLQECNLVLKQTRVYRKLHRLVSLEQAPSAGLQAARDELVLAIRTLKQALGETQSSGAGSGHILAVALDASQKLLEARQSLRPAAVGLEVDRAEEEMRSSARRLNDLVGHAVDEEALDRIEQQAQAAGFSLIERQPLHHNGDNLVGWLLNMRRA